MKPNERSKRIDAVDAFLMEFSGEYSKQDAIDARVASGLEVSLEVEVEADSSENETQGSSKKARYRPDDDFKRIVKIDVELTREDYDLAATEAQKLTLLPQTGQGHAQSGHIGFNASGLVYPNCTIADYMEAMGLDVKKQRNYRANQVRTSKRVVKELTKKFRKIRRRSVDREFYLTHNLTKNGAPLAGIQLFHDMPIRLRELKSFFQGLYMGARFDGATSRAKAEKQYYTEDDDRLKMHKGVCVAVNLEALIDSGLTLQDLSNCTSPEFAAHGFSKYVTMRYRQLVDAGIIIDENRVKSKSGITSAYYELTKGAGGSDDASFINLMLLYGVPAALGFLVVDAIDTMDKEMPYITKDGEDAKIAEHLTGPCKIKIEKHLGITDEDVSRYIFLSSKGRKKWVSSSQRRFLQRYNSQTHKYSGKKKAGDGLYAVQAHLMFGEYLRGEREESPPSIPLAYERVPSQRFHELIVHRIRGALTRGELKIEDYPHLKNYSRLFNDKDVRKALK